MKTVVSDIDNNGGVFTIPEQTGLRRKTSYKRKRRAPFNQCLPKLIRKNARFTDTF